MKEDLEAVVERLKPLFPADIRVVAAYAESYHAEFASQLSALTQFELCPRDTYMLLLWVQNLYPNDILNSPKLAPELQGVRLGTLLPPTQIQLLEARFLSNEVTRVRELMARALELESKSWTKDEAPLRLNSRCFSELAIHIIQIISQGQAKAESITLDLGTQIKPLLLEELARFLRSYQRAFDGFLERCRQLRNYRANVIANINNCLPFRTSLEQQWQTPPDLRSSLLRPLNELKSHGFDTLLQSLFGDLKPLFKRFTQTRWAAPQQTLEEIVSAVAERMPEFSELQDCFREELLEAVHLHLVKEYIARLCKRRLVLKTAEQQQQLAGHVQANAQLIQQFCTQNVSPRPPSQPPMVVGCPPAPSSSRARTSSLGLFKPDQVRPEPLWAPGHDSGQGQPLSTKPVPAGLPSHLAARRPPQARRDHSPARPQCHQD
uniref:Tumor necrosis factor alpha-induced protein 2 n=1 Tax=Bos mutus grunniens TaxID=30521 RepID=A0A8C0AJH4_BOSMU